jgi:hypothetical protein
MIVLDFLFHYMALHSEKWDKNRVKHMDPAEGARNLLSISIFIWLMIIECIVNYIVSGEIKLISISWRLLLFLSLMLYGGVTYIYIEKGRYNRINQREHSENKKFIISDENGILIALIFTYTSFVIIILGLLVWSLYNKLM